MNIFFLDSFSFSKRLIVFFFLEYEDLVYNLEVFFSTTRLLFSTCGVLIELYFSLLIYCFILLVHIFKRSGLIISTKEGRKQFSHIKTCSLRRRKWKMSTRFWIAALSSTICSFLTSCNFRRWLIFNAQFLLDFF